MNCLMGRFAGWRSVALVVLLGCLHSPANSEAGWLRAWGHNGFGQCEVPPGDDFVAVAATAHTSMALREDGSVVFWGDDFWAGYFQEIWTGSDFVAIRSGGSFGAIKEDGSLFPTGGDVPVGNDFVDMAVGSGHGLALREDGSLVGWGRNHFHQADVPAGNDFAAVAAGLNSSMVLKQDGSVLSWGDSTSLSTGPDFAAIAAQWGNKLGLRKDGSLKSWGLGEQAPEGNFAAIACGWYHSLAIRTDGSLVAWGGSNGSGQLDVPPGNKFVDIAAGIYHSVAIEVPEPSTLAALLTMAATAAFIAWWRRR